MKIMTLLGYVLLCINTAVFAMDEDIFNPCSPNNNYLVSQTTPDSINNNNIAQNVHNLTGQLRGTDIAYTYDQLILDYHHTRFHKLDRNQCSMRLIKSFYQSSDINSWVLELAFCTLENVYYSTLENDIPPFKHDLPRLLEKKVIHSFWFKNIYLRSWELVYPLPPDQEWRSFILDYYKNKTHPVTNNRLLISMIILQNIAQLRDKIEVFNAQATKFHFTNQDYTQLTEFSLGIAIIESFRKKSFLDYQILQKLINNFPNLHIHNSPYLHIFQTVVQHPVTDLHHDASWSEIYDNLPTPASFNTAVMSPLKENPTHKPTKNYGKEGKEEINSELSDGFGQSNIDLFSLPELDLDWAENE